MIVLLNNDTPQRVLEYPSNCTLEASRAHIKRFLSYNLSK